MFGGPSEMPLRSWYLSGTTHFQPIILTWRKWISLSGRVKRPVLHNLVWRIRSWSIWSSAQDLNVCTERWAPKIWNVAARKWTYIMFGWGGWRWIIISNFGVYPILRVWKRTSFVPFVSKFPRRFDSPWMLAVCQRFFYITNKSSMWPPNRQHHSKREIGVGWNLNTTSIFKYS